MKGGEPFGKSVNNEWSLEEVVRLLEARREKSGSMKNEDCQLPSVDHTSSDFATNSKNNGAVYPMVRRKIDVSCTYRVVPVRSGRYQYRVCVGAFLLQRSTCLGCMAVENLASGSGSKIIANEEFALVDKCS